MLQPHLLLNVRFSQRPIEQRFAEHQRDLSRVIALLVDLPLSSFNVRKIFSVGAQMRNVTSAMSLETFTEEWAVLGVAGAFSRSR